MDPDEMTCVADEEDPRQARGTVEIGLGQT
jgi:hypothetical protein